MSWWRVVSNEIAATLKPGDVYEGGVVRYITVRNDRTSTLTLEHEPPRRRDRTLEGVFRRRNTIGDRFYRWWYR